MEDRCHGFLSVILLFLKFSSSLGNNSSQIVGGNFDHLNLKCHPRLTAIVRGNNLANGNLNSDGYEYTTGNFERVNATHFRICVCNGRPCLRRCCDQDQVISNESKQCVPANRTYNVEVDVYDLYNHVVPNYDLARFYKVYGDTCPNKKFRLNPSDPLDTSYFRFDGTLSVPGMDNSIYKTDFFCFEIIASETTAIQGTFVCFPESPAEEQDPEYTAYPIGMIISIPFLLATFLVYALIPELRNLHGKNSMCHVSSLLTAYIFLVIVQLKGDSLEKTFCIVCGFVVQFSFLATFFWLNVMCFDIWWAFSGFRGFGGLKGSTKEREWKKFLIYSCYAWGGPALLLAVSLMMDLSPNIPDYVLKPNIGRIRCFFDTKMATLAYFYGPMAVLIIANIGFFLMTAIKIFVIRKETSVLGGNESRQSNEANKQRKGSRFFSAASRRENIFRFILYLKLFLVMGINWMCEVISWAVDGPKWVWYVTDVCNTLQGVFIFLIFVCKSRIKKLVMQRLCPSLLPRDVDTTTSSLKISMSRNSSVVIGPGGDNTVKMNTYPIRKTSTEHYK